MYHSVPLASHLLRYFRDASLDIDTSPTWSSLLVPFFLYLSSPFVYCFFSFILLRGIFSLLSFLSLLRPVACFAFYVFPLLAVSPCVNRWLSSSISTSPVLFHCHLCACWCSISDALYVAGISVVMSFMMFSMLCSHSLFSVTSSSLIP